MIYYISANEDQPQCVQGIKTRSKLFPMKFRCRKQSYRMLTLNSRAIETSAFRSMKILK